MDKDLTVIFSLSNGQEFHVTKEVIKCLWWDVDENEYTMAELKPETLMSEIVDRRVGGFMLPAVGMYEDEPGDWDEEPDLIGDIFILPAHLVYAILPRQRKKISFDP